MPQETNTGGIEQPVTHWYQVPLLWISLAMFTLMLLACIHLILLSLDLPDEQFPVDGKQTNNPAFFRMPLHSTPIESPTSVEASKPDDKS